MLQPYIKQKITWQTVLCLHLMVEDFVSSSVVILWLACELFDCTTLYTRHYSNGNKKKKSLVYLQAEFVFLRRKCDEVLLQTQNQEKHQTESYKARIKVSITDIV
jgi:hypothetical protein